MRSIALISDGRTSHGIYKPVLDKLREDPDLDYLYVLTGMHLSDDFGSTIEMVKDEGYEVGEVVAFDQMDNSRRSQAMAVGFYIQELTEIFSRRKVDVVLAQGDRGITLAAAVAGAYLSIPVAHMHGGEISGTVDECVRHAITKLSHLHFAASQASAERILRLGEDAWRVIVTGAAGIEYICKQHLLSKEEVYSHIGFAEDQDYVVFLLHPDPTDKTVTRDRIRGVLEGIGNFGCNVVMIYPNNDPGHMDIIEELNGFHQRHESTSRIFKNVPYQRYLSLLKYSRGLVGNSSGGIIETPSLKIPNINIGARQKARERADNAIDIGYDGGETFEALERIFNDSAYLATVQAGRTPYDPHGDGEIAARIIAVLKEVSIDDVLLNKQISY